jgi:hypothetical protein
MHRAWSEAMLRGLLARWRACRLAKIPDDHGYPGDADRAAIQQGREANNHLAAPMQSYYAPRDRP